MTSQKKARSKKVKPIPPETGWVLVANDRIQSGLIPGRNLAVSRKKLRSYIDDLDYTVMRAEIRVLP